MYNELYLYVDILKENRVYLTIFKDQIQKAKIIGGLFKYGP
jgi:hypothetical protein